MSPRAERPDMAGYGVGDDWDPLPWPWAAERLAQGHNYWLVTANAAARPHAMPVWAVWDDADEQIALSCAPTARKARNLRENPAAVITVEDTVECVSVEGTCVEVPPGERFETWIERYLEKYLPVGPDLTPEFFRRNLMFEFTPERAFGIIERPGEFSTRATRWVF